jgi:hypothetical protein
MTMWEDEISWDGPKAIYQSRSRVRTRRNPGEAERFENLIWARDHCEGHLRVVMMRARDEDAVPRSIASCFPDDDLIMRITQLDEANGSFRAESVGS